MRREPERVVGRRGLLQLQGRPRSTSGVSTVYGPRKQTPAASVTVVMHSGWGVSTPPRQLQTAVVSVWVLLRTVALRVALSLTIRSGAQVEALLTMVRHRTPVPKVLQATRLVLVSGRLLVASR